MIEITTTGVNETLQSMIMLPGLYKRARKSALSSISYMFVSQEIKDFIQSGGQGWDELHPLTVLFGKMKNKDWRKRKHKGVLNWLARYVRYTVDPEGFSSRIGFGKGRKNIGKADNKFNAMLRRIHEGEDVTVSPQMRRKLAATVLRRKKGQPGKTYFPISSSTTELHTPARPVIDPVMSKIGSQIPGKFEEKFFLNLIRYGAY